jgi:hypothetical protein
MAQFRLQVVLPDRPGSLGAVASAIGFAGGDIRGLVVMKSEDGRGSTKGTNADRSSAKPNAQAAKNALKRNVKVTNTMWNDLRDMAGWN